MRGQFESHGIIAPSRFEPVTIGYGSGSVRTSSLIASSRFKAAFHFSECSIAPLPWIFVDRGVPSSRTESFEEPSFSWLPSVKALLRYIKQKETKVTKFFCLIRGSSKVNRRSTRWTAAAATARCRIKKATAGISRRDVRRWRSWFDSDFFEQSGES